jgi:hypothetical protein
MGRAGWRRATDRFTVQIEEDRLMEIIRGS